jgi:hypothetical protein
MVLSLGGTITIDQLSTRFFTVCGHGCKITHYWANNPATQCSNCFECGHATMLCKKDTPTWKVCGDAHNTSQHPCLARGCPKGRKCTLGKMWCTLCKMNTHRSFDQGCPKRARINLQTINRNRPGGPEPIDIDRETS